MKRALFFLCVLTSFIGCRYTYEVPSGTERSNFGVGVIGNTTFENELTPVVRREIKRQLAARAPLNIIDPRPGVPSISGNITDYSRSSLRSDDNARAAEFRITISVEFVMSDANGNEVWRKTMTGEETFAAGGGAELAAQRGAVDDMVVKLIHALFPAW